MTIVLSSSSGSSFGIATYGDLKEKTAQWLNRSNLTSVIPDFVQLAETSIRRDVRVRVQELLITGTLTGETLAFPTRFLDARRLVVGGKKKTYLTPEEYTDFVAASRTGDHFTIIGESIYVLNAVSGDAYALLYWQQFTSFIADTDTNWLLTNAPEVYLWAACKHGAEYEKDFEAADRFEQKYQAAVAMLNASEKNMRYSGSALMVRTSNGVTP